MLQSNKLIRLFEFHFYTFCRDRHGRDRTVVGFTTTYAISAYYQWIYEFESRSGEVYSIQHYVIKCVSDLIQVGSFLRFPPPINLTVTIELKYC